MRRAALLTGVGATVVLCGGMRLFGAQTSAPRLRETPRPAIPNDWQKIPKKPLREFKPAQPTRIELPNGLVVFLQEDHELPVVSGMARIRGGSRDEAAEKVGLVSLYGQTWRTGGTKEKTGDELDDFLEARAAKVETGGGLDSTFISFNCLKANFDEVFPAFSRLLLAPEFRKDKLELAKNLANTAISRRNDEPMGIASREARKIGYGASSPYARTAEYSTIAAVDRDDLVNWHKTYAHPNNMILGLVGDFDAAAMQVAIRKAFEGWAKGPTAPKRNDTFADPKPGVYYVAKDDVTQSGIRMVHLGTQRNSPDFFALEVMNEMFGGGFSARLMTNVRSKKGLAYSVTGGVGMSFDYPGLFQVLMGTKSESTAAAIEALYTEVDNLTKAPPTADEIRKAKDSILNSFIFRFDSREKVLYEKMLYEFYGYPLNFLEGYQAGIEKVTAPDVFEAAKKYVHRDRIALLVVGKSADFDKPLSTFGPVTNVDITIPELGSGKEADAKAPAASDDAAKALFAKVVQSFGGSEKIRAVKAILQKATITLAAGMGGGNVTMSSEALTVSPDRMRQHMETPMGGATVVVSPQAAFLANTQGVTDMPSSQKEAALKDLKLHPFPVIAQADDPKLRVRAGGSQKVGDIEGEVLQIELDGNEAQWVIDPASGRLLRTISRPDGAPVDQISDFLDWREVGGIPFSYKRVMRRGEQDAGSLQVDEIVVNPPIDDRLFQKPEPKK